MVEISTKTKQNLDKLVESIILQAEILDLKTIMSQSYGRLWSQKLMLEEDL